MFSGGLFALGEAGPLLFLFLGPSVIGLLFSGAAIFVRLRADSEATAGETQPKIDTAIAVFAISGLLSILGLILNRYWVDTGTGMMLAIVGIFLLLPVSAVLAIRGRGAGREVLLVGHGLVALLVSVLLLSILIHGLQ
jgi:hypothetical protein